MNALVQKLAIHLEREMQAGGRPRSSAA
jgi:hypothetical protein